MRTKPIVPLLVLVLLAAAFAAPAPDLAAADSNLVPNPSFEEMTDGGLPAGWAKGRWGTNAAVFTYPVAGFEGSRAARVELVSRTSGDAKWYFRDAAVSAGRTYRFSDTSMATVTSYVTVQYRFSDGTLRWQDILVLAPSGSWRRAEATFSVPAGVTSLTVFHLINGVGSLTVDSYSLAEVTPETPARGLVSINFDDGWKTTYGNALPILNRSGLVSSHYIITGRFSFPAYVTAEQTRAIAAAGHEVGAHTRTHRDLTTLSEADARNEIFGSLQDLKAIGIASVQTFAHPFGAYSAATLRLVQEAGFSGARSSDGGFNAPPIRQFALARQPMELDTTFDRAKAWIDSAVANDTWLILVFHRVDESGTKYSVSPALLQQVVDYLKARGVRVVPTAEGLRLRGQ